MHRNKHVDNKKQVRLETIRAELLSIADADQRDLRESIAYIATLRQKREQYRQGRKLFARCHRRAERVLSILESIKQPSISAIGTDGCEAILLVTQHSYLKIMKKVLALFLLVDTLSPGEVPKKICPHSLIVSLFLKLGSKDTERNG